jgi:hypothetical protein
MKAHAIPKESSMTRGHSRIAATTSFLAVLVLGSAASLAAIIQSNGDSQACSGSTVDVQGAEVAKKSRAFLAELQSAVSTDDKNKVAAMISYPLLVIHGSQRTRIKTKAAFLSGYPRIFDDQVRRSIAQQSAKCLFGNYQGTMIGNGEVWFSEQQNGTVKIITVNPGAGK